MHTCIAGDANRPDIACHSSVDTRSRRANLFNIPQNHYLVLLPTIGCGDRLLSSLRDCAPTKQRKRTLPAVSICRLLRDGLEYGANCYCPSVLLLIHISSEEIWKIDVTEQVGLGLTNLGSLLFGTAFYSVIVLVSITKSKTEGIMLKNWHLSEAYIFLTFMLIAPQSLYETIANAAS